MVFRVGIGILVDFVGVFLGRDIFVSEECFICFKVDGFDDVGIGGDIVVNFEFDDIVGNQFVGFNGGCGVIFDYVGGGRVERFERGNGFGSLKILEEVNNNVDGDQIS